MHLRHKIIMHMKLKHKIKVHCCSMLAKIAILYHYITEYLILIYEQNEYKILRNAHYCIQDMVHVKHETNLYIIYIYDGN